MSETRSSGKGVLAAGDTTRLAVPPTPTPSPCDTEETVDMTTVTTINDNVTLAGEEKPGDVIGRYKLLEKLGEGGFGVVYIAEQTEPVKRKVALKITKLGMDT